MKENANKLHFRCTNFNSLMLIVDKHCSGVCCDGLPVPQIDRKSKQVKEPYRWKFLFATSMENNSLFWTPKISKCVDE